jgi:hypothetical protein
VFVEVSVELGTDCALTGMFARWRLPVGSAEGVPPLYSCTWPEHRHAVMVRLMMAALVDVCFDATGYCGYRQN